MKSIITKMAMVVLAVVLITGGLMGCEKSTDVSNVPDVSNVKEPSGPGFEIGFIVNSSGGNNPPLNPIQYAVKSEFSTFDLCAVTLDFYYGLNSKVPIPGSDPDWDNFCYALYFSNKQNNEPPYTTVDDYRSINGLFYIKDISLADINSGKYSHSWTVLEPAPSGAIGGGAKLQFNFNHHETITIPKELFKNGNGSFFFYFAFVRVAKENTGYQVIFGSGLEIHYEYDIEEQTVKIKP